MMVTVIPDVVGSVGTLSIVLKKDWRDWKPEESWSFKPFFVKIGLNCRKIPGNLKRLLCHSRLWKLLANTGGKNSISRRRRTNCVKTKIVKYNNTSAIRFVMLPWTIKKINLEQEVEEKRYGEEFACHYGFMLNNIEFFNVKVSLGAV